MQPCRVPHKQPVSLTHPGDNALARAQTAVAGAGGGEEGGPEPTQLDRGDVGEEEPEGFKTAPGAQPGCSQPT